MAKYWHYLHLESNFAIRRINILIIFHVSFVFLTTLTAQYRFDVWTTENGLPQNSVNSIIQTKDGYIWFATFGGLVRDDGIWFAMTGGASRFKDGVFTNYFGENDLLNDNVRDIYEDRDGVLWFGTYGGGLNRFKDGKFFAITTREGMNEDIVSRITNSSTKFPRRPARRSIRRVKSRIISDLRSSNGSV